MSCEQFVFDPARLTKAAKRLIIASEYDPFSIVETLFPFLAGSASIVVHSPHVQVHPLS